jgi:large subunit ribosomal protein L13
MKILDGTNASLGRVASFAAKESLKGEEITVINCDKIVITGSKKDIQEEFLQKRRMVGTLQVGPKHSRLTEKIVKRTIRGMLPKHKWGRGKDVLKNIKCYNQVPKEFEGKETIAFEDKTKNKHVSINWVAK